MISGKSKEELRTKFKIVYPIMKKNILSPDNETYKNICSSWLEFSNDLRLRKRLECLSEHEDNEKWSLQFYDFTSEIYKKRIAATIKYYDDVRRELKGCLTEKEFIEQVILANSLIMRGGYNSLDSLYFITSAAAIWMLDNLSLQNKLDDMYRFLPKEKDVMGEDYIPWIGHPSYSPELISAMIYLIVHRNDEIRLTNGVHGSLVSEISSDYECSENKKNFRSVLEMLDKESIQIACDKYKEKILEFYRLSFEIVHITNLKIKELEKDVEELEKKIKSKTNIRVLSANSMIGALDKMDDDSRLLMQKRQELNDLYFRTNGIYTDLSLENDREKNAKEFSDILPEELIEDICNFSVDDPYEYAFALLYLLETDSLLPWLYYGSISVAYTIYDQLPFNIQPKKLFDLVMNTSFNKLLFENRFSGSKYENQRNSFGETVNRDKAKNLSQIVFANSSCVLPRISAPESVLNSFVEDIGVADDNEKEWLKLILFLLDSSSDHKSNPFLLQDSEDVEETDSTEVAYSEDDFESLLKQLQAQKDKNKSLQSLLYEKNIRLREAENNCASLATQVNTLMTEVSDLRQLVYNNINNIIENEMTEKIDFPYSTKEKIVSFGGHTTWLKSIRKLLPDVRFIEPDKIADNSVIYNADVIWIQTNCLPHSDFYRIINIVREHGKRLRYFTSSSAEKCAEQIVCSVK